VVLPHLPLWEAEDSLDELSRLADTATLREARRVLQARDRVDATFYVGRGKADELRQVAQECGADLIVFDNDLSPAQMRNLEKTTGQRVLDRSGLILDIFALHARTRTAQLQVELAQLNYLLPRLTGQWTHLSRQAGGGAIRGMGAVGVRGPGETQLETDRRMIRKRVRDLDAKLERISSQMATSRKGRRDLFRVALVGYTNAGKSTLMRALSGADVLVEDRLFATLDSTTRAVSLAPRAKVLLTDTVGFIKRLPHHLFASFRATLEETVEADLLLHVVDLSYPHYEAQMATVDEVLRTLGVAGKPCLVVYNKIDRIDPQEMERISLAYARQADTVAVSALSGAGLEVLREKILFFCRESGVTLDLEIPQAEGRLLSQLHHQADILEQAFQDDHVRLRVRLDPSRARRWQLERFARG
jgi:GTP-binding protein HflX